MPDDATATDSEAIPIVVPADVQAAFGPIVALILESESMNDDERRYWIDILPAMNAEQVSKLQDILTREKEQLAAIDAKYSGDRTAVTEAKSIEHIGEERRARRDGLAVTEAEVTAGDALATENILDQIENA